MGTVIRIILMRYLWREVKVKFLREVFVCSPKRCELSTRGYQSPMRVVVDQSSLHRLAILHFGVPSPGIFLMAAFAQPRCFDWRA